MNHTATAPCEARSSTSMNLRRGTGAAIAGCGLSLALVLGTSLPASAGVVVFTQPKQQVCLIKRTNIQFSLRFELSIEVLPDGKQRSVISDLKVKKSGSVKGKTVQVRNIDGGLLEITGRQKGTNEKFWCMVEPWSPDTKFKGVLLKDVR